jgi:transcriptional regulator with XRE-family HTH domain
MKMKSEKRMFAEQLRLEHGLSYSEISRRIGVSKSTLSNWLKHIDLTPEQETRIRQRLEANQSFFVAYAGQINRERFRKARANAFQTGVNVVSKLPNDAALHELALAMLYLGEGDKTGNRLQIASVDPQILRYFLWAVETLYGVSRTQMSFRLHLIKAASPLEDRMIDWWAEQLFCSPTQFKRTQFDQRSRHTSITDNYRGVCTVTHNDTYLFERLVGVYSSYIEECLGK